MLDSFSGRVAGSIKRSIPEHPASEAVLKYGINIILTAVLTLLLGTVLGMAVCTLMDTWKVLFAIALLRVISGGYHFKSGFLCVMVSAGTAVGITLIQVSTGSILVINLVNTVMIIAFAPSGIDRQTRIPKRYYPLLKLASVLVVLANLYIHSSLLALGWLLQAVSLVRRR